MANDATAPPPPRLAGLAPFSRRSDASNLSGLSQGGSPMPPEVRARANKRLASCWPVPLKDRCHVGLIAAGKLEKLAGLQGYSQWPEPSRTAFVAETEGFAAASAYAAGKSLATDEERADVFKKYLTVVSCTAKRRAMARLQAAGTSRSGTAAQPPPAASVAVVSGPVQPRGRRPCLRRRLPPPTQE